MFRQVCEMFLNAALVSSVGEDVSSIACFLTHLCCFFCIVLESLTPSRHYRRRNHVGYCLINIHQSGHTPSVLWSWYINSYMFNKQADSCHIPQGCQTQGPGAKSNSRPGGQIQPATSFYVARKSLQRIEYVYYTVTCHFTEAPCPCPTMHLILWHAHWRDLQLFALDFCFQT